MEHATKTYQQVKTWGIDDYDSSGLVGVRRVKCNGREGINLTGVNDAIALDGHTLNSNAGMLEMWVLSLEDLIPSGHTPTAPKEMQPFISDIAGNNDALNATFALSYKSDWGHPLIGKFYRGSNYPGAFFPYQKAIIECDHVHLHKGQWYHFVLTWDVEESQYHFYMNGMPVGHSDALCDHLVKEKTGETLYIGTPCFCYSDITMYEGKTNCQSEIKALYLNSVVERNEAEDAKLRQLIYGNPDKQMTFQPDANWEKQLGLSLQNDADLEHFYVQGGTNHHRITPEGLEIKTPNYHPICLTIPDGDMGQMYLWSNKSFEGDLYAKYEFMPKAHGGLSLFIAQASGMFREDFMKEYPLRTDGAMASIHSSNLRMYHWEYFREMSDTQNNTPSNGVIKWPNARPMSYGVLSKPIDLNKWHTLEFLQQGAHVQCALDGEIVCEFDDDPAANHGSTLSNGHIAIRCMIRTHMLFKNIEVYTKPQFDFIPIA